MKLKWTRSASNDLVRLHRFLEPVAPEAAARVVQDLARAPERLLDFPRIGEKLDAYQPREVRRLIVGDYELRYEIANGTIMVLRLWHSREDRPVDGDE
jgi:plasmid stabilization system protein ParE